jgi:NitT/TauT family transport system substrate-binding protein
MHTPNGKHFACWLGGIGLALTFAGGAMAQDVKIGVQTGLGYLPLQVMVHDKLLDKQARARGLDNVKTEIVSFANAGAMNDALLSNSILYASGGVSTFLTLWAKANGVNQVKSDGALLSMPMYLNTRSPTVKSIQDFSEKDRIGVAGIKVGYQAILLQMAAAKAFGEKNYAKLDPLTVTVSNPDGLIALSNSVGEINTHFAPPPYAQQELRFPGVRTVLKSYDILGGPATLNEVWSTVKSSTQNPKLHEAFLAALKESIDSINADKKNAARIYLQMSGDKTSEEEILSQLNDAEIQYSMVPNRVMVIADFMRKIGTIKKPFNSWHDFYFQELGKLPGS